MVIGRLAYYKKPLYNRTSYKYGGPQVITEMIELCIEILEDRDDKIPAGGVGRKGYLAKVTDQNSRRTDGKIANLMYVERA